MVTVVSIGNHFDIFSYDNKYSLKEEVGYKNFVGIAIGGIIILADIIGIQIFGASMNPARSYAPALVFGNLTYNLVYWIATIIGVIIAVFAFRIVKSTATSIAADDNNTELTEPDDNRWGKEGGEVFIT